MDRTGFDQSTARSTGAGGEPRPAARGNAKEVVLSSLVAPADAATIVDDADVEGEANEEGG